MRKDTSTTTSIGSKGSARTDEPFGPVYAMYSTDMRGVVADAIDVCRERGKLGIGDISAQVEKMRVHFSWEKPAAEKHDPAHLARAAEAVRRKPATLEDKIARCMNHEGISVEEEEEYQRVQRRIRQIAW